MNSGQQPIANHSAEVEAICACLDRLGGTMARLPSVGAPLPGASPALAFNGGGSFAAIGAGADVLGALHGSTLGRFANANALLAQATAVGADVEGLQGLAFAATERGVDRATLDRALETLATRMVEAAAEGGTLDGIAVAKSGRMRDLVDVLSDISARIAGFGAEDGVGRLSAGTAFFGGDAAGMQALLSGGSDAFGDLLTRADSLGAVMPESLVRRLADADRSVGSLIAQVEALYSRSLSLQADFWRSGSEMLKTTIGSTPDREDVTAMGEKVDEFVRGMQDAGGAALDSFQEFVEDLFGTVVDLAVGSPAGESGPPEDPRFQRLPPGNLGRGHILIPLAPPAEGNAGVPAPAAIREADDALERATAGLDRATASWRLHRETVEDVGIGYGRIMATAGRLPADLVDGMEAIERIGRGVSDAFQRAVLEGESVMDVLHSLERQVLNLATHKLITAPLDAALDGLFANILGDLGKSGGGGLLSGLGGGLLGGIGSFLGFAEGGSFRVGGSGGPDSKLVPLML